MAAVRVLADHPDVDARLAEFGVTRQELLEVVRGVVAARSDATLDDPASAEGLLAYIYGTRYVRQVFLAHEWVRYRENNVESVKHPDRPLKVVYQSVDLAADTLHKPQAVSGKGSGADRIIAVGQAGLFPEEEMSAARDQSLAELQTGVWFFCVSVQGDDVRAELSLPSGISGGNFEGFIERIFILGGGEWPADAILDGDRPDGIEFEPAVLRR
ncbi:hypothetical protein LJE71_19430 [Xanthobacter autotrophicus]|uniref:hypothetical protein n=1 Tax=Xanthobacter autotrophicus TaxID=280 RepID=UPI001E5F31F1|nr:hypothetical protein [Xanthobacter autotrophicus]UDQ88408.1 hypothetical protein LJE71_19430 [Xanthobacter autotrophicus]